MKVKITLLEEVLGSSPSNEDLLATYIASKAPTSDITTEEVDNIKAQNAEDRITVFPKTADGTPFLYDYQVKGMFKDSCKMLAKPDPGCSELPVFLPLLQVACKRRAESKDRRCAGGCRADRQRRRHMDALPL